MKHLNHIMDNTHNHLSHIIDLNMTAMPNNSSGAMTKKTIMHSRALWLLAIVLVAVQTFMVAFRGRSQKYHDSVNSFIIRYPIKW